MDARRVTRRLLFGALLLTVASVWSAAPLFGAEPVANADPAATAAVSDAEDGIIVYYFHGNRRCNTCRTIEAYAKEAVEGKYTEQLEAGRLRWDVVNTDEQENEHFLEEFGLVSSSLVVAEMDGDRVTRFQVLQDVWTLVRDKPSFIEYVQRSIGEYIRS